MGSLQKLNRRFLESVSLFAVFGLIGITFFGFSALTPTLSTNANKQVLGEKTSTKLYYYPISTKNVSIVKDTELSLSSDQQSNATYVFNFTPFEASEYDFSVLQIKNDSEFPAKVKISPSFSESNTGIGIDIVVDGVSIPMIDVNGTVLVPEVTVEPKSITPVSLKVSSKQKINVSSTLTLSIVRFE